MIITVNNKYFHVPATVVVKVQNMAEHNKTVAEIAHAIRRPRPVAYAIKMRIVEEAQMKKEMVA